MDQQALANPDLLFIYDHRLVNDMRLFPNISGRPPVNLTFWGGCGRGSDEYKARLAAFGIDGDHFTAKDWHHSSIRLLSFQAEPSEPLLMYLHEKLGDAVVCDSQQISAGLYSHRFFIANAVTD